MVCAAKGKAPAWKLSASETGCRGREQTANHLAEEELLRIGRAWEAQVPRGHQAGLRHVVEVVLHDHRAGMFAHRADRNRAFVNVDPVCFQQLLARARQDLPSRSDRCRHSAASPTSNLGVARRLPCPATHSTGRCARRPCSTSAASTGVQTVGAEIRPQAAALPQARIMISPALARWSMTEPSAMFSVVLRPTASQFCWIRSMLSIVSLSVDGMSTINSSGVPSARSRSPSPSTSFRPMPSSRALACIRIVLRHRTATTPHTASCLLRTGIRGFRR